jgi:hypothetical protein
MLFRFNQLRTIPFIGLREEVCSGGTFFPGGLFRGGEKITRFQGERLSLMKVPLPTSRRGVVSMIGRPGGTKTGANQDVEDRRARKRKGRVFGQFFGK